jgi:hypothetical protein
MSNLGDHDIADKNRELAHKGTAIATGARVDRGDEFGVPSVDRVTT